MTSSGTEAPFIETKQYHRFTEFCDACREDQYIGLCHGVPGVGKTLSARRYANWDIVSRYRPNKPGCGVTLEEVLGSAAVFYTPPVVANSVTVPNDIDKLRGMLGEFLLEKIRGEETPRLLAAQRQVDAMHKPYYERGESGYAVPPEEVVRRQDAWQAAHDHMEQRIDAQPDPTALILIDEADRLKMTGVEQVRAIFDRGGIGLVLIGMPGLEKRLARYPQLYSRVGFVHEFKPLSQDEVRQMLRQRWAPSGVALPEEGVIDDEAIAALIRIAEGRFRLLHLLLTQIGRVLEISKLEMVTREVVEAARESLVVGTV